MTVPEDRVLIIVPAWNEARNAARDLELKLAPN